LQRQAPVGPAWPIAAGGNDVVRICRIINAFCSHYDPGAGLMVSIAGVTRSDDVNNQYVFLTEADFTRVMALQPGPSLRAELERAIVVARDAIPPDVVTMYSIVRYRDVHAGVTREIQIVYPEESDLAGGKISVLAPVGAALLGLAAGQSIDWPFPGGETRRLIVEAVVSQPDD
jgi:regulator of nucleoside diphosphate kinase